ncbi:hypothetical protein [Methanobacterium petrolearium]|uniref:hypothetical protein n=1 Tax=Methanobacterium petrolearium TaxID=710190 RepID=UPI001AE36A12|nr:hypothetical protein [Methanobacterium petrolearium]MBP1945352.1 hypothetical protein [Methanobacterium petrolearium]BDZ71541.1 hypothetical protein GCM10025861_20580 [Methanobacterium petrolearium]
MKFIKNMSWRVKLGIFLVVLSAFLYFLDIIIFHDVEHVFFYIGIDTAFLPIEILLVVLVIESAISEREKQNMMEKLNMVIGAFFSEVGTDLLAALTKFDPNTEKIRKILLINNAWSENDFARAKDEIQNLNYEIKIDGENKDSIKFLENTKEELVGKRKFLLALLENPNLLEHESFTELLWAVFHFMEELEHRNDISQLPVADYHHLSGDTARVYGLLINEWLEYMEHLMNNYPYLFSLAIRTNPFDPSAKVEISE